LDDPPLLKWIGLVVLLLLSAIFSGAETALTTLSKLKLKHLQETLGKKGKILDLWLHHPRRLLTTILVGNNLVNVAAAAIATVLALNFAQARGMSHSTGVGIATGVMTLVILIFGEITPKTFAQQNSERLAPGALRFIYFLSFVFFPLVKVLAFISQTIIRLLGGKVAKSSPFLTDQEIKSLISAGEKEGVLETEEKEMIEGVIEFGDTEVSEIMTPRVDILAIEYNSSLPNILDLAKEKTYSRIPLYRENIDNIIGILYVKDLLNCWKNGDSQNVRLKDLMRKPYFVPESKKLDDLLREFRLEKTHIAVVVDEYGGTAGLVTIEDLLEEIVGEIEDEFDKEEKLWAKVGTNIFVVDAKLEIDKASEELGINLPEDDFETVGGFVVQYLEDVPEKGEILTYRNYKIIVLDADEKRVKKLKIIKLPGEEQDESKAGDTK